MNTVSYTVGRIRNYSEILKVSKDLAEYNKPFKRILELVFRSGARYFTKWEEKNNKGWLAERDLCYKRFHPPVPEHLIRLDFFSSKPSKNMSPNSRYLGYVSLRPGPYPSVAECLIQPPTDTRNRFLLCNCRLKMDHPLSGVKLKIGKAHSPFIQQDKVAGVCAHAGIRTISLILSDCFSGCQPLTVKDIQKYSSTMPLFEGSHIPSTGLMEYEIVTAFEKIGTQPLLHYFKAGMEKHEQVTFEQLVYPYIESGIPVFLSISTESSRHVVVIVGHTFDQDSWWRQAEGGYFPTLSSGITWIPSYTWVPDFLVQDDNFGPYMTIPRQLLWSMATSVIIPVPKSCNAFLAGYQAESLAIRFLSRELYNYVIQRTQTKRIWKEVLEEQRENVTMLKQNIPTSPKLVIRPLLISKESIKEHIEREGLSHRLSDIYQQIDLPPWVWFIEVSTPELYSYGKKIGELILNASYPKAHIMTGVEPLLAFRVLDIVVAGTTRNDLYIIDDTNPTSILVRPSFDKC